jgi:predicted PurR-regulated permease PerM
MAPRDVVEPGERAASTPAADVPAAVASPAPRAPRRWGPRDIAPVVIATIAVVFALRYAADFVVPVVAGVLLAYALEPLVARMAKARIPRVVGASLLLAAIVSFVAGTAWWLRHDATAVVSDLPEAARKLRISLQSGEGVKPLAKVREAAAELEKAAAAAAGNAPAKPVPAAPPVQSELSAQITAHGATLVKVAGQLAIAATLTLFLLAAGDTFRRKLVRLVGPSLSKRRITVEILDEIDLQVQRYLLVMLVTNVAIAFSCWAAFAALGLQRAALWAALTGVLHFIPYVGSVLALVLVGAAAIIETGSVSTAAWTIVVTSAIFAVLGMGLNTWLQGRACRMNAVAVFVAVLLFGWMWGAWGLLLGAPLAAVAKTIADRVESLNAFGELLGEAPVRVAPAST